MRDKVWAELERQIAPYSEMVEKKPHYGLKGRDVNVTLSLQEVIRWRKPASVEIQVGRSFTRETFKRISPKASDDELATKVREMVSLFLERVKRETEQKKFERESQELLVEEFSSLMPSPPTLAQLPGNVLNSEYPDEKGSVSISHEGEGRFKVTFYLRHLSSRGVKQLLMTVNDILGGKEG